MIVITGDVELRPEHRAAGIALCREHSERSRKEPGCISHDCTIDLENDNLVRFIERWEDMAAVQVHFQVPEAQGLVASLSDFKAAPFVIRLFDANPVDEISA
ncbi:MAG: putative quinol monooxygenase [Erythrobacter sp.]